MANILELKINSAGGYILIADNASLADTKIALEKALIVVMTQIRAHNRKTHSDVETMIGKSVIEGATRI